MSFQKSPHRVPKPLPPCEGNQKSRSLQLRISTSLELNHAGILLLDFEPPESGEINSAIYNPVCGNLLQQPEETKTGLKTCPQILKKKVVLQKSSFQANGGWFNGIKWCMYH